MRWPWSKQTESRASYTDAVVGALLAASQGKASNAHATAALEACACLFSSALTRTKVEPAIPAISPTFLALVARDLIRRGESVHAISIETGAMRFLPAGTWEIRGAPDEASWVYRLHHFGPSGSQSALLPGASVLHFRYAVDAARPWLGVGPLGWAKATGALAGRLEGGLADEAGAAAALLLPVPSDGGDSGANDPLSQLKSDLAAAKGKPVLIETTSMGWGSGQASAPRQDWKQTRLGADWPDVLRATRDDVFQHVSAACNVPAGLFDPKSPGAGQREALRRWVHLGVEPLGALVAGELASKLDLPDLALDFSALMASDLAGKARAIKGLVEAGIDLSQAVRIGGLDDAG